MRPSTPDLSTDPEARLARKRPVEVQVEFARRAGVLRTHEGEVRYASGDALVTGSAGDRWPIVRATFDESYVAVAPTRPGDDGVYCKQAREVLARRIQGPFAVDLSAGRGRLTGNAGDWLVQYSPGDVAIVAASIFRETYELLDT